MPSFRRARNAALAETAAWAFLSGSSSSAVIKSPDMHLHKLRDRGWGGEGCDGDENGATSLVAQHAVARSAPKTPVTRVMNQTFGASPLPIDKPVLQCSRCPVEARERVSRGAHSETRRGAVFIAFTASHTMSDDGWGETEDNSGWGEAEFEEEDGDENQEVCHQREHFFFTSHLYFYFIRNSLDKSIDTPRICSNCV